MRCYAIFPSLFTISAATEIRFAADDKCGGPYVACSDIDSVTCCVPGPFVAKTAQFINTPVRAILAVYQANDTEPACAVGNSAGQTTDPGSVDCIGYAPQVGSARWKDHSGGKDCESIQMVDVLVLDAVTRYSLNRMDAEMQQQLVDFAVELKARDVPEHFEQFRLK